MVITKDKLERRDYYRVQMQLSPEAKTRYAAFYNFMARKYPDNANKVRDYFSTIVIKRVMEEFESIWKSNPTARAIYPRWMEENIDPQLWGEINQIIFQIK